MEIYLDAGLRFKLSSSVRILLFVVICGTVACEKRVAGSSAPELGRGPASTTRGTDSGTTEAGTCWDCVIDSTTGLPKIDSSVIQVGAKAPAKVFTHKPINAQANGRFGSRLDPVLLKRGIKEWRSHNGEDYRAEVGTKIFAAAAGKIVFAGKQKGYGCTLEIQHAGGYMTRSAHLQETKDKICNFPVSRDTYVKGGDVVGYVNSTGRVTGSHLHFEIIRNNEFLNPTATLREHMAR